MRIIILLIDKINEHWTENSNWFKSRRLAPLFSSVFFQKNIFSSFNSIDLLDFSFKFFLQKLILLKYWHSSSSNHQKQLKMPNIDYKFIDMQNISHSVAFSFATEYRYHRLARSAYRCHQNHAANQRQPFWHYFQCCVAVTFAKWMNHFITIVEWVTNSYSVIFFSEIYSKSKAKKHFECWNRETVL